ncbi:MAG: hypothetical protein QM756_44645 [Polyangiaceae bacterium]
MPTRARSTRVFGQALHGALGVVERDAVDWDVAERNASDVDLAQVRQPPLVLRRVLCLHVIGVQLVQPSRRPTLADLAERWHVGRAFLHQLFADELARHLNDASQ